MNFPEILREIMIEHDFNQISLAKKTGLKQGQISEWLNGKSKPGYDNLRILSLSLEISGDRLLGLKEE